MLTSARGASPAFPAPPKTASPSNWSFAVISDPQGNGQDTTPYPSSCVNTQVDQAIAEAIINDGASFVIVAGDLQHGQEGGYDDYTIAHQLPLWTNAVAALGRAGIPYYAVRGNHETYKKGNAEDPYKAWAHHVGFKMPTNGPDGETGMSYSFPTNNALFIGLDSFDGTKDSTYHCKINQNWLNSQLASNTRQHLFVFGHEPAFEATIWCLSSNILERNQFWNSLGNANARAYFCGHSHLYARCLASISNGPALRQIIVGTDGGALSSWKGEYAEPSHSGAAIVAETNQIHHWGYMLVRVSGNHVSMEYKSARTNDVAQNHAVWTTNDTFQYTIITTPTNLQATGNTGNVLVSWNSTDDASGYEVWRGTSDAPTAGRTRIGVTTSTLFSDTNAVAAIHYYYWVLATNTVGTSLFSAPAIGWRSIHADFEGDGLADPFAVVNGEWTFWLSSGSYLPSEPNLFSVPNGIPLVGHFDSDSRTDPVMVANGEWTFWLSSGGYLPSGPHIFSVPNGVPLAGDFDGDGLADPVMVANGEWTFWLSSGGYRPSDTYIFSLPDGVPLAGDFDGDGLADPVMVANGGWTHWLSSNGYQPSGPCIFSIPNGVPLTGDFDGDGLADPVMVASNNWTIWFSSSGYLPSGPHLFKP